MIVALVQDFNQLHYIHLPNVSLSLERWQMEDSLILSLANGEDVGPQSDRLVPKYQCQDWLGPVKRLNNHGFISFLQEKIKLEVDRFERCHISTTVGFSQA